MCVTSAEAEEDGRASGCVRAATRDWGHSGWGSQGCCHPFREISAALASLTLHWGLEAPLQASLRHLFWDMEQVGTGQGA